MEEEKSSFVEQPKKRIELIENIGEGNFGEVWVARHLDTNPETGETVKNLVAVKFEIK